MPLLVVIRLSRAKWRNNYLLAADNLWKGIKRSERLQNGQHLLKCAPDSMWLHETYHLQEHCQGTVRMTNSKTIIKKVGTIENVSWAFRVGHAEWVFFGCLGCFSEVLTTRGLLSIIVLPGIDRVFLLLGHISLVKLYQLCV